MNVLVAYASAHGSTAGIAAFIGEELRRRKFVVTVADVEEVTSVQDYDAFVLGSAVHEGMWLTGMSQFLERFQDELRAAPTVYFMACVRVLEPGGEAHARQAYVNQRVLEDLNIEEVAVFAGKLELDKVDWNERWALAARYDGSRLPGSFNRDFRDWEKIRTWAQKIADKFLITG